MREVSETPTPVVPVVNKVIDPDTYFDDNAPPSNLQWAHQSVREFVGRQGERPIVLVTSGGTTVPLENNTVRFVDNFSAGTRGSSSAEQFLELGYAVIFLYREHSLQPFNRHYSHNGLGLLDYLEEDPSGGARVKSEFAGSVRRDLERYQKHEQQLLKVTFTTLSDYLFLLREVSQILAPESRRTMFYLAAAVSDFFIPSHNMAEHKIQSGTGDLTLRMNQVPKFLRPLVANWVPQCFTVSFKLETDPSLLIPKAKHALEKYGHQIVVANLLDTRKRQVWLVTRDSDPCLLQISPEQLAQGRDIEQDLVAELARRHALYKAATSD